MPPTARKPRRCARGRSNSTCAAGDTACGRMDARFGKGTSDALLRDPVTAWRRRKRQDVPLLYWTAASWGAAISLGIDRPDLAIDFPDGPRPGRSRTGARPGVEQGRHSRADDHARQPAGGRSAAAPSGRASTSRRRRDPEGSVTGPYVALATGISVPAQDRAEFERLLKEALAIDPEKDPSQPPSTLITQRRARALLEHIDQKFSK